VRENFAVLSKRDCRFILFGLKDNAMSWRGLGLFALVFFGLLILAGAILPLIYWTAEWAATDLDSELAQSFLRNRTDKVFDFLRWVPVLGWTPLGHVAVPPLVLECAGTCADWTCPIYFSLGICCWHGSGCRVGGRSNGLRNGRC
jgi:hypothetical protein